MALGDVSLTGNQPLPGALELEHRRLPKTARGAPSTSSAAQAFFSFHRLDSVLQVRVMMHSTRRFREEFYDRSVRPIRTTAKCIGPAARSGFVDHRYMAGPAVAHQPSASGRNWWPVTPKHAQARRQGRADIPAARAGNRSEKWHR